MMKNSLFKLQIMIIKKSWHKDQQTKIFIWYCIRLFCLFVFNQLYDCLIDLGDPVFQMISINVSMLLCLGLNLRKFYIESQFISSNVPSKTFGNPQSCKQRYKTLYRTLAHDYQCQYRQNWKSPHCNSCLFRVFGCPLLSGFYTAQQQWGTFILMGFIKASHYCFCCYKTVFRLFHAQIMRRSHLKLTTARSIELMSTVLKLFSSMTVSKIIIGTSANYELYAKSAVNFILEYPNINNEINPASSLVGK